MVLFWEKVNKDTHILPVGGSFLGKEYKEWFKSGQTSILVDRHTIDTLWVVLFQAWKYAVLIWGSAFGGFKLGGSCKWF